MERSPAPRILDATPTECVQSVRAPLDPAAVAALVELTALPGTATAVPAVAATHPLHPDLLPLVKAAHVLEPLDAAAHQWTREVARPDQVVVDPTGHPLDRLPDDLEPFATGIREVVVWLPSPIRDASGGTDPMDDLLMRLDAWHGLDPRLRIRLRDPHGLLRPDTVHALLDHPSAPRLTLLLEDARGVALATAHLARDRADGPTVRSTLLGIGPRTGLPPTELLVPHHPALYDAAQATALLAQEPISPRHPLWGSRRHEILEPERIHTSADAARARWNPATLPVLVSHHLDDLGLASDPATVERLTRLLAHRLRPGEDLDGPMLYAFLATHHDLKAHVDRETDKG